MRTMENDAGQIQSMSYFKDALCNTFCSLFPEFMLPLHKCYLINEYLPAPFRVLKPFFRRLKKGFNTRNVTEK